MPPVETVLAENAQLKERVAALEAQIAWFRKQVFGGGKSEKVAVDQLELELDNLKKAEAEREETEKVSCERRKSKKRRNRDELYGNLPVEEETVVEPEEVQADPSAYKRIGEEETFEVKIVPPRFFRRRIVRPKYRRKNDAKAAPVVAPSPFRVVEGIASAELLAYVAVSKYLDHLPLYRQCAIYKRYGFRMERQTATRWVEQIAEWLKPIYNRMRSDLLSGGYVQVDETPIKYQDPDYGEKKTRTGHLCGMTRPGGDVWYKWSCSRSHASVCSYLDGFEGVLQADMYEAYPKLERDGEGIELAACWAHARRKFFEIKERAPRECNLVLKLIGKLYAVEKTIRQRRENESDFGDAEAKSLREQGSANAHARLKRVLMIVRQRCLPKSELGKACDYSLSHWKYLSTYLKHGHVEIDNNGMENAIRPTAVGKKNWLFVGHPKAGERSAILYSVLISCQRLGIQPLEYLTELLKTNLPILSEEEQRKLTPSAWAKSRGQI